MNSIYSSILNALWSVYVRKKKLKKRSEKPVGSEAGEETDGRTDTTECIMSNYGINYQKKWYQPAVSVLLYRV